MTARVERREENLDVAYHEAGHFVIAHTLGLDTVDVRIYPGSPTTGYAVWRHQFHPGSRRNKRDGWLYRSEWGDWPRSAGLAMWVATYAGPLTVNLLRPGCRNYTRLPPKGADKHHLNEVTHILQLTKRQRRQLRAFAQRLIWRNNELIERVALELARHKTLTGNDVNRIIVEMFEGNAWSANNEALIDEMRPVRKTP